MIRFENFNYWYPDQTSPALTAVNWNVDAGEFILLAGQSGSGKSTFLRAINGLVPHFTGGRVAGSALVGGVDPVAAGPEVMSRQVGFVAQDPESQGVLDTVEAEIAFPLENAAVPPSEMRIRVEEVLDLLGLARLRQRPLQQLSGGERQRVAIATALVFRPSVLLLDEPTSQLDPQSAEDVLRALVRLNEDLALTIVLAEHRLERILAYVDRVTYLEDGKIAVDAPAREAVATMPGVPPLVELARRRNWRPIPLTVKEARPFVVAIDPVTPDNNTSASNPANGNGPVTNLLVVDQLSYAFGDRQVLTNVSLQVNAGETVALVGRNGSGKTTLLRSIVGLLPTYRGAVTLHGRPTRGRPVAEICRQVGYLPQNPDDLLYAETAREELALTLENHGQPIGAADIDQWLADLGLSEVGERYPRDLSVGQRQRVALGAITVTWPSLVLLDEPTRGLDGAAKLSLAALLQKWQREGTGLLIVSHDVEFVAIIANRAIMLAEGEVIADGATQDVLGASPHFAPQIARLFPGRGWLTVQDALKGLRAESQGVGQCQS